MVILEIPVATPSLNETSQAHWIAGYRLKKRWKKLVRDAFYQSRANSPGSTHDAPPCARVHIVRYGKKRLDYDNFIGGLKPLIDALKLCALIQDDDVSHVHIDAHQYAPASVPRTVVSITAALA